MIDPAGNSTPPIDCTDVVESIVNKATSAQNDKLDKIKTTMEIQQQQFTNIITVLTGLTEELQKTPPSNKFPVSTYEFFRKPTTKCIISS